MTKTWKQVKIFTADAEQSITLEPTPERDGIVMYTKEEIENGKTFATYLNKQEAIDLVQMINDFIVDEVK